jgi:hypothetical protein
MGPNIPRQHSLDVLSLQSRCAAYEARRRDHQHRVDQFRSAKPHPTRLCDDQGCNSQLHRGSRTAPRGKADPRKRSRAGPHLDAIDPVNVVGRFGLQLRQHDGLLEARGSAHPLRRPHGSSLQRVTTMAVGAHHGPARGYRQRLLRRLPYSGRWLNRSAR